MKQAQHASEAEGLYALVRHGERVEKVPACTDARLWMACEKHLPHDILLPALLRLTELMELARQAHAAARKADSRAAGIRGRPEGGVGAEVDELIDRGLFQSTARAYVARKRALPYETVADLHRRRRRYRK
ncbi:hypothetical protein ACH79_28485 [Bradyrhizobium sp. CCBAU 051011]|uniref:hypothetical protein n=1 Tax=Bradyrhizobium sp. CCBAU 051011 TaxID=858422 RepID=UPI001373A909|nr:hypothetical protein [Bradyrhizobium sp. CCBAU 051011]QHO75964.1 hypothetical protein ACH79_28485 [Bradyrhizobium sp. CCBAU 051011]